MNATEVKQDLTRPPAPRFYVGVDTHTNTHTIAVLDAVGRVRETHTYPATPGGYRKVINLLTGLGGPSVVQAGVEGTNSYGAGLTRALQANGFTVFEVLRPARQVRRLDGKSDPIDAVEAARTLMIGRGISTPKSATGVAESLRYLNAARNNYVSTMTSISNQILGFLVTAPAPLRQKYRAKETSQTLQKLRNSRPAHLDETSVDFHVLTTMKTLAKTHQHLKEAAENLEQQMNALLQEHYPALLALYGVGTITAATLVATAGDNPSRIRSEAAFAKMCGACPIPASSGKTSRHRINRGGNRQANAALHRIALTRMNSDETTRQYVARQTKAGKTKREITRQLKRALCRSIYRALVNPHQLQQTRQDTPHLDGKNLRQLRTQKGFTQTQVATALATSPTQISNIETENRHLPKLRIRYHQWLQKPHHQPTQQPTPTPQGTHKKAA